MSNTVYDGLMAYIYDDAPYFGKHRPGMAIHYLNELKKNKSNRVLEFGTATGLLTIPMLQAGLCVDTVDYAEDMQHVTKMKIEENCKDILQKSRFILADITKFKPDRKYEAIVIPDSILLVLSEPDEFVRVLKICFEALNSGGIILFDIYIPSVKKIKQERYSDASRFREKNGMVCVIEANHEIKAQKQCQTSVYRFKERYTKNEYVQIGAITIEYYYKSLSQVIYLLEEIGFCDIEVKEMLDGEVFFISAKKLK